MFAVQIVWEHRGERRELDVRVNNPAATVADLAAALDPAGQHARGLTIDGRPTDPEMELAEAGLYDGATLRLDDGRSRDSGALDHRVAPPRPRELVVSRGLDVGRSFPLDADVMVIGRVRGCAVELADPSVSKRHARLTIATDGQILLDDLGSLNGTWVNETPVTEPTPLDDDTTIRMGIVELHLRPLPHPQADRGAPAANRVRAPGGTGTRELVVINGLDAGRRFPLVTDVMDVGRVRACAVELNDPSVSKRHAQLTIATDGQILLDDLGSLNGTWVNATPVTEPTPLDDDTTIRMGAVELQVRSPHRGDRSLSVDPLRHTTAAGTIPFNRPPRASPAPPPKPLDPPKPPNLNQARTPLSLIGVLAPLVFAGVLFAFTGFLMFLLFAGLSPIMAIGNYIDNRRRGKRSARGERQRYHKELAELEQRIAGLADEERDRRAAAYPDPAEIVRRTALPSTTLWQRRPTHADYLCLRAGIGDVPWTPIAPPDRPGEVPEELTATIERTATLIRAPVTVDLAGGGVVGIVGDRSEALAVARSLVCQAAALHGPADLPIMVLVSPDARDGWDWAKWLPHTRDPSGAGRYLSSDARTSTETVEARLQQAGPRERPAPGVAPPAGPALLVVVDDESLTKGRKAPVRNLLRGDAGPVAGVVVASMTERLPALCTAVIELSDPNGRADLVVPHEGQRISGFLAAGVADDVARGCARSLARFEDPELDIVGAGLPAAVRLLPLLGLEESSAEAVLARWKSGGIDPPLTAPLGLSEDGVFTLDVVRDGPHGLIGGTTGAGKSELLRTLVAGLAASVDPDHLTFVLVDFKGGSAFDECARLPHTVGMVTDLDEHLAERALRCLEAELKHRERVLREVGAVDLPDYRRGRHDREPLPRLLVVIDEFATLKAELPDFIDALVGVAQRGRSLGVHLLLATQRPQGAISDNIRANTNLRIALRVQDHADSSDIIDVPDAAAIPRSAPGRAYVRLGPGEVVPIQSALATGPRSQVAPPPVDADLFVFGPQPRVSIPAGAEPDPGDEEGTDLGLLVDVIQAAFEHTRRPAPRRPWPEPLPHEVDLDELLDARAAAARDDQREAPGLVPLALADDPEAQDQYPMGWVPRDGNLLVYGIGGSGTTTTLSSLAVALARLHPPDDLHLHVLDCGAGELISLEPLPHVGSVITATERERQARLIRHLRAELDRRRRQGVEAARHEPTIVILVDGWAALVAEHDDVEGQALIDSFVRVVADGPEMGIYTVITGDRVSAVPPRISSLVRQRWVLRLADSGEYSTVGLRLSALPDMSPGRALVTETGQLVQIARPTEHLHAVVARLATEQPPPGRPPPPVTTLATAVPLDTLEADAGLGARPWTLPIAVAEETLAPAQLFAYQGEHAIVVGPPRSGKTTALLTIAAACRAGRPDANVVAVAGPRSALGTSPHLDRAVAPAEVDADLVPPAGTDRPTVLLVDDIHTIDDPAGVLQALCVSDRPDILVVGAARNDTVRGYGHWSNVLRRARLGLLLRPQPDMDTPVFQFTPPRRPPVAMTAGRGYLVNNGQGELVQVALPY